MPADPVQESISAFWTMVAPGYEAHPGNVPSVASAEYAAWVAAIRDLLPRAPSDVLDVATGTGFVALIAAGLGHRVVGIDLSDAMLGEARKEAERRGLALRFERRDAVNPDLAAGSFDAIISRHFLWTLREPETALRDWRKLLRPAGRLIAIDGHWFPDAEPPAEGQAGGPFDRYYTRETRAALPWMTARSPQPVIAAFERAGFTQVELSYLREVHAQALEPPSQEPWYVVVARL